MPSLEDYQKAGQSIFDKLHLSTYPVAIKFYKDLNDIPEGVKRPSQADDKWCICQAFTYARRWGWTTAMGSEDNFCTPSVWMMGWEDLPVDTQVEGQVRQGWHLDREAEYRIQEFGINMLDGMENFKKLKEYNGMVISPLHKTKVIPDSVLIYGNGGEITHIIHALTYEAKNFPFSGFEGFGESCHKGSLVPWMTGVPQIVIPGTGDRTFSGTYDYEVAIGMPGELIFDVDKYLFVGGGRQNMGMPIKTLLPRRIPESLTPGFKFMRQQMEEYRQKKEAEGGE